MADISVQEAQGLPAKWKRMIFEQTGTVVSVDGKLYTAANNLIFCGAEDPEVRIILEAIAGAGKPEGKKRDVGTASEAWRQCLLSGRPEIVRQLTETFHVQDPRDRCVLLFRSRQEGERLSLSTMSELAPTNEEETLIEMPRGSIAVIRGAAEQSLEDLQEYTQAVAEFAESEIGLQLTAGIGSIQDSLERLHESWREAEEALRIGTQFHLSETVHVYQKQILERLLSAVPEQEREKCRRQIFNEKTRRLLNEEMRETIRVFFENDLNLSTTARQLYLHRNTLTYRLDRIRRETGLDLRSFRDAAAFKAIMECPGEEESWNRKVEGNR